MSVYRKILVATDFSDINQAAIQRATNLAKLDKCDLIVLHVIEHFPVSEGPLSSVFQDSAGTNDELTGIYRNKMAELVSKLDHDKIQAEFRVTSKSARHEILRFAQAHDVDLIVVAPHGTGIVGTLGSTASGVLNNATCDVLAVREK